jgi:hypothetical protein
MKSDEEDSTIQTRVKQLHAERDAWEGTGLAIPAGYALVPVEPTPAMFAEHAPEDERPGDFGTMKYRRGIWKAMLRAAGVTGVDRG